MSHTECARQGAEAIGAKTRRREVHPVFRTIRSVPRIEPQAQRDYSNSRIELELTSHTHE
eukprot:4606002-Prymnesium_polylepis.2